VAGIGVPGGCWLASQNGEWFGVIRKVCAPVTSFTAGGGVQDGERSIDRFAPTFTASRRRTAGAPRLRVLVECAAIEAAGADREEGGDCGWENGDAAEWTDE
jgi:hypothetical protein